jgi:transposase-like protein
VTVAGGTLKPLADAPPIVTLLVDIGCPSCDRVRPVRKVGIGTYRCGACGHEFGHDELQP